MDRTKGTELMLKALKSFNGRFRKFYGQMAMRLDENTYIMTEGNCNLATTGRDSLLICDIKTGDLGEIFRKTGHNALIFGLTPSIVKVSGRPGPLPVTLEDLAHITGPELPIAPNNSPSSIIGALSSGSVCMIRNTGAIAAGSNLKKAVAGINIIDKFCEAEVFGALIGGTVPIDAAAALQCRREFNEDYVNRNEEPSVPYVGFDEREFTLRSSLIEHGKLLVSKDLTFGSWGNLSARLNENEMLITPSAMDYGEINIEDIVRVNIHTLQYSNQRIPSSEAPAHAAVYRETPDCQAVVHTHSNALSVFAACEAGFAITDPEMHKLIGDVLKTEFRPSESLEHITSIAQTMRNTHAAIIPHHGAIFTGPSIEVAFAIAEAVELRARRLLGYGGDSDRYTDTEKDAGN